MQDIRNETLAVTLGELQAQIYWLHDAEQFVELASAAATIYMKLGYTLTCFLMEIGRVHKSRDIETTKQNAIRYWTELLKIQPTQYPYLG